MIAKYTRVENASARGHHGNEGSVSINHSDKAGSPSGEQLGRSSRRNEGGKH